MGYNITAYGSTGFNTINLPYSKSILENNLNKWTFPAIDLLQNKWLAEISVKLRLSGSLPSGLPSIFDNELLESIDYLKVTSDGTEYTGAAANSDVYYVVTGFEKTSADVVKFHCIMDFITTMGGIDALSLSDGIIVRQTITAAENVWGNEIIEDELLGCNEPLQIAYEWIGLGSNDNYELIESTIDLAAAGISYERIDDAGSGGASAQSALVPTMKAAGESRRTNYKIQIYNPNSGQSTARDIEGLSGGEVYKANEPNVQARIADARSLRIENGILNQYAVPVNMASVVLQQPPSGSTVSTMSVMGYYDELSPTENDLKYIPAGATQELPNNYYARIFQGDNNKYGLMSCTGDKIEFAPEDIRLSNENYPVIQRIVDPRADGRPYYQSKYFHKTTTPELFNAIAGAQWGKLPLKYTDISGLAILEQQFKNTSKISARQYQGTQAQLANALSTARLSEAMGYIGGVASLGANAAKSIGGAFAGATMPGASPDGMLSSLMGSGGGMIGQATDFMRQRMFSMAAANAAEIASDTAFGVYQSQRQKELYDYGVSAYTVAPEINFPADLNTLRSLERNGVLIYKYRPTNTDLKRHNTILNMYGIKCNKPITDFSPTNGTYFYYVQIKGAKVSGRSRNNNAIAEGAAAQLAAGVRFWKAAGLTNGTQHIDLSKYTAYNAN